VSTFVGFRTDTVLRSWYIRVCKPMKGETAELWRKLCEQAAVEQDPEKLLELASEINRLLDEKEARLKGEPGS
jgi:hypothetical protein